MASLPVVLGFVVVDAPQVAHTIVQVHVAAAGGDVEIVIINFYMCFVLL